MRSMVASKLKEMLADEDAVSPVIGVILMVAVTVVLAAVIAGFVFGLGDNLGESAPNAQIEFDYDAANTELGIYHDGGDSISSSNTQRLRIANVDGQDLTANNPSWASDPPLAAVSSERTADSAEATVTGSIEAGDQIVSLGSMSDSGSADLVWVGSSGDQSSTLGEWEGPSA